MCVVVITPTAITIVTLHRFPRVDALLRFDSRLSFDLFELMIFASAPSSIRPSRVVAMLRFGIVFGSAAIIFIDNCGSRGGGTRPLL